MSEQFQRVNLNSDGSEVGKQAEPQGFYAQDAHGNFGGAFLDGDALARAVSNEKYANDPEYRRIVQDLVSRTSEEVLVGKPKPYDGSAITETELATDFITSLMQDPRYQTSAIYRQNVQAQIAASMSPRSLRLDRGANTGCQRVVLDSSASVDPMGKK